MNSRERVFAALARTTPDRVPCRSSLMDVDFEWLQATFKLKGREAVLEFMLDDFRSVFPAYIGPPLTVSPRTGALMTPWGITFKGGDYSLDGFPLANASMEQIEAYPWFPRVEWYDFASFAQRPPQAHTRAIFCGEPFSLISKAYDLTGMEQLMVDMFDRPDFVHVLMRKITQSRRDFIEKALATAPWIDIIELNDDMGTQHDLILGLDLWQEFVAPYLKILTDCIHAHGKKAYYHSCGSIIKLIPGLIEAGVDILDNIQPTADGMDPYAIKREFGDRIVLHAQVDEQHIMREGPPDRVYATYRQIIEDLAIDGGFIISATFRSQNTPPENLKALLRAVREPL